MIDKVKIDKLCFGADNVSPTLIENIEQVVQRYYEVSFCKKNTSKKYGKLYEEVTPTKQRREYFSGNNHNLQMIPLDKFKDFLIELLEIAGQDLNVYEIHLAKDIITTQNTEQYLNTVKNHEYANGYMTFTTEANSTNTVYVAKRKNLDSQHKQKLVIKFYDKKQEMINNNPANRVLEIKEPLTCSEIPTDIVNGKKVILLYKMKLLRCELELRENNLPYKTIEQIIKAIDDNTIEDILGKSYSDILRETMFVMPKPTSCKTLNELAITLSKNSNRDYKTLSYNNEMSREYRYFKQKKEVITRENDLNFEELRTKLIMG